MQFSSVGIHFTMLAVISVHIFFELIINLRFYMTGHDIFHMEYHCVLLSNFYTVSDTWIVRIELKSSIFQVSIKVLIE